MNVAIIKYNAGNISSVSAALKRLDVRSVVTDNPEIICKADRVVFPGVGEARTTMDFLKANKMDALIKDLKQPVLGICLGMQLLCSHSEEGNTDCLGVFDTKVKKFVPSNEYKVPHMGWNVIEDLKSDLFTPDLEGRFVYFVHSYYVPVNEYTIATTSYIQSFSAALQKDNFYATQFHPEKSESVGDAILKNFLRL